MMQRFAFIVCFLSAPAYASTARLVDGSGTVEVIDTSGNPHILYRGARVSEGETVRTGSDGQARLLIDEQAVIDLAASSQLGMSRGAAAGNTSIALRAGRLWARVSALFGSQTFEVTTENAVAGVRGTSFFTEVESGTTTVSVEAGSVDVRSHNGERALLGVSERARVATHLERSVIEKGGLERLHERVVAREHNQGLESVRAGLGHDMQHMRENDRDDGRLRETLRETMRARRDGGLDVDPGIARRLLERLRELHERRRANP